MDVEVLLSPIAAHSPCGEDMSFSNEFDQIAEMRRADDPSLDQGAWVTALKQADWPGVVRQCSDLLRTRTKDLRLALWLTEARALSEGHRGLAEGLDLCAALCQRHWPELHPLPDHGDMEERIGNIAWLLQRLVELAPALPVTHSRKGERFSLRDLAHARLQDAKAGDGHGASGSTSSAGASTRPDGGPPLTAARFRQALADTPATQLRSTFAAQQDAQAALLRWQAVVDAHLGQDGPSFVAAREALAQVTHELGRLLREVGVAPAVAGSAPGEGVAAPAGSPQALSLGVTQEAARMAGDAGEAGQDATSLTAAHAQAHAHAHAHAQGGLLRAPQTRSEALQQLREVAAFFRQTEPHSPVAYLAEKAVKWGDMPLHQWLQEVVKDSGTMGHLNELLGLPGADPEGAGHAR